eukprot:365847-Chlamydomonas_euryale.AAC.16
MPLQRLIYVRLSPDKNSLTAASSPAVQARATWVVSDSPPSEPLTSLPRPAFTRLEPPALCGQHRRGRGVVFETTRATALAAWRQLRALPSCSRFTRQRRSAQSWCNSTE